MTGRMNGDEISVGEWADRRWVPWTKSDHEIARDQGANPQLCEGIVPGEVVLV